MKKSIKLIAASLVLACCIKFSVFAAPAPVSSDNTNTASTVETTEDAGQDIMPLEDDPFADGGV